MSFKMDVEEYLAGTEQVLCNFPSILCRLCRAQRTKEALTILSTGFLLLFDDNKQPNFYNSCLIQSYSLELDNTEGVITI